MHALGVPVAEFKEAYEWLRRHNQGFARVAWDEASAAVLGDVSGPLGLPPQLA